MKINEFDERLKIEEQNFPLHRCAIYYFFKKIIISMHMNRTLIRMFFFN